jgi:AraC-like DNA-binding protein
VNHYFKCNYKSLLNRYRILHAKQLIDNDECAVTELEKRCGFTSRSVFYDAFSKIMGVPPAHYRKRREKATETGSGFSETTENPLKKNEMHQQQVI